MYFYFTTTSYLSRSVRGPCVLPDTKLDQYVNEHRPWKIHPRNVRSLRVSFSTTLLSRRCGSSSEVSIGPEPDRSSIFRRSFLKYSKDYDVHGPSVKEGRRTLTLTPTGEQGSRRWWFVAMSRRRRNSCLTCPLSTDLLKSAQGTLSDPCLKTQEGSVCYRYLRD